MRQLTDAPVAESCGGWLSTRNKRKIQPRSPKHKRRRLSTMRVFPRQTSSVYHLTQTGPPHPLLFSSTRQTTMHGYLATKPTQTSSKTGNANSELYPDVVIVDPLPGSADHMDLDSVDHMDLDSVKSDHVDLNRWEITHPSMSHREPNDDDDEVAVEYKQKTTGRTNTRRGAIGAACKKANSAKDEDDESRQGSGDSSRRKCLDKGQNRNSKGQNRNSDIEHISTRSSQQDNSTVKHEITQNREPDKFEATSEMSSSECYDDYEYHDVRQNVLKELNIDNTLTFTDTFSDYESIHKTRLRMFNMDDSLSSDSQSWKHDSKDITDEKVTSVENKDCDVDGPFHPTEKENMKKFIGPPAETCNKKFARDCSEGKHHYKKERPLVYVPLGRKVDGCDSLQFSQSETVPPGASSLLDKDSVERRTPDPVIVERCRSQQTLADAKSLSAEVPSKRPTATGQVTRRGPSWTPRLCQDRSRRHLESSSGELICENRVCSDSSIASDYDRNYSASLSGSEFCFKSYVLPELENTLTFTPSE